jgi:hypothetical protein
MKCHYENVADRSRNRHDGSANRFDPIHGPLVSRLTLPFNGAPLAARPLQGLVRP